MARPLSEEKRESLLAAAAELVATVGTAAPTVRIAKAAGVSEGTLFTYFASKDELLNQLFLSIEEDLARVLTDGYPAQADARERSWHVWSRLIDWGAAHPHKLRAMRQLKASDRVSDESRQCGDSLFRPIRKLQDKDLASHMAGGQGIRYAYAVLNALADTTLDFIAAHPRKHEHYKRSGFEIFWTGIART
ncbi:TetR/AcrR family transcriptional regulator [Dyella sp.]|uniref:TetR/AcrR family transcriptional regulator n=1 Tax=Dyella sp. TaxID=1869338 RepID=UPI002ED6AE90